MKKIITISLLVLAINIGAQTKTKKEVADSLEMMGTNFHNLGSIPQALNYYGQALKIYEELGDKSGVAVLLLNMGLIYNNEGDTIKAFVNFNKSLKLSEEIGDSVQIANSLFNIGYIYRNQGDMERALNFNLQSLKIREIIGDRDGIGYSLNSIGIIYKKMGNPTTALYYYNQSLDIRKEIGDEKGIAYALDDIGIVYFELKKYRTALSYEDSSLAISKRLGYAENIRNAEMMLTKIDSASGNFNNAFAHYKQYIIYRDYLNNLETHKASLKSQLNYDFEKKELTIKAEQAKRDAITQAELKHKEQERNYFIAGFGLVMILLIFIFKGYRNTKKANVIISEQKKLVDKKNKDVMDSIRYAQRIQKSLITPEQYIEKSLNRLAV